LNGEAGIAIGASGAPALRVVNGIQALGSGAVPNFDSVATLEGSEKQRAIEYASVRERRKSKSLRLPCLPAGSRSCLDVPGPVESEWDE